MGRFECIQNLYKACPDADIDRIHLFREFKSIRKTRDVFELDLLKIV